MEQSGIRMKSISPNPVLHRPIFFWRKNPMPDHLLANVQELHQKAIAGDKKAVQDSFVLLEKMRKSFPVNQLIEAYYGSILVFQGRDAVEPIERLQKVRQGLKFLDDAVLAELNNIEIRIIRGYVCYHLPEVFFHRTATAIDDFTYLAARFEKDPTLFTNQFFQQIQKNLKSAYQRLGRTAAEPLIQDNVENPKKEENRNEFPF